MIRSYDPEYTPSRPIWEVKQDSARPVLRTEMTREALVTNLLPPFCAIKLCGRDCAPNGSEKRANEAVFGGPSPADGAPGRVTPRAPVRTEVESALGGRVFGEASRLASTLIIHSFISIYPRWLCSPDIHDGYHLRFPVNQHIAPPPPWSVQTRLRVHCTDALGTEVPCSLSTLMPRLTHEVWYASAKSVEWRM